MDYLKTTYIDIEYSMLLDWLNLVFNWDEFL